MRNLARRGSLAICLDIVGYVGPHETAFLEGACWALAVFLRSRHQGAVIWHEPVIGHLFIVKDGVGYDARGVIDIPSNAVTDISPRALSQMRRSAGRKLIQIGHWDRIL